jgi:hypothetical protein
MQDKIDPKAALQLRKKTSVVVSWYRSSTGSRFGAGKILKGGRKTLLLLLMVPNEKTKTLELKLKHHRLMNGRTEYVLYEPGEKEIGSIARLHDTYMSSKLGWRWKAHKKHKLRSDWRFWAQRRALEMSRVCEP